MESPEGDSPKAKFHRVKVEAPIYRDLDHREQAGSDPVTFFGAKKDIPILGAKNISILQINLGEVKETRFQLLEPAGRVEAPGTSLMFIKIYFIMSKKGSGQ